MEFFENQHRGPFSGLIFLWRKFQALRLRWQTRKILRALSDKQLKDLGLRREELG
ncbi:DUF1127 domain-containing protein [Kosakonia oryziphila]|jgi:Domain of unknown function (DUF1127).|uniref:Uncharacterized conserved protein YjiS, DUF1127 family n=1 Tax=Kosakonia oryziphila TaxID=1005667 RepID=A0A1C3YTI8_9ENTR|nr:DUF1127 domain-containing protein [Kosakonia oryziphila]SCB73338.1 Uncharacterized conserved protein YjiS, DUF1127 family [Kosakonia oryziphila]